MTPKAPINTAIPIFMIDNNPSRQLPLPFPFLPLDGPLMPPGFVAGMPVLCVVFAAVLPGVAQSGSNDMVEFC
eukprot:CAMPEP_0202458084 /NCGR_PEP_ID=MMETSP1360-20130828/20912_1 /ASSEMBLY_ACC=CAM_ASM_000848 /TAXON_ID=515479 /ORGANISM="Licmophora paradoxa, Strain CCMP2313" /LENGTH=72 /DNA_ID=CAMNT_0049078435 /DNA_START=433 /DNA_END=648 /DNA_ORIENTATION=+